MLIFIFVLVPKTLPKVAKINFCILEFILHYFDIGISNFFRQSHQEKVDVTHVQATNARLWFFQVHT